MWSIIAHYPDGTSQVLEDRTHVSANSADITASLLALRLHKYLTSLCIESHHTYHSADVTYVLPGGVETCVTFESRYTS